MKFSGYVLKRLFMKPSTGMYPAIKKEFYDRTRGHVAIDINSCSFCGLCARKCPTLGINVDRPGQSWGIDRLKCIQCNNCIETCPKKCLTMENSYTPPSVGDVKEVFRNARVSDNQENH